MGGGDTGVVMEELRTLRLKLLMPPVPEMSVRRTASQEAMQNSSQSGMLPVCLTKLSDLVLRFNLNAIPRALVGESPEDVESMVMQLNLEYVPYE